jgi:hypothetical protein
MTRNGGKMAHTKLCVIQMHSDYTTTLIGSTSLNYVKDCYVDLSVFRKAKRKGFVFGINI